MSLINKTFHNLIANLSFLLESNIEILKIDMNNSPAFDPNHPYNEKNQYINSSNQIGLKFLRRELPQLAEVYYSKLLDTILRFEEENDKFFNKGIVYANLGIAQMAMDKFDFGIPNLLKAYEEDKDLINQSPERELIHKPLYKQFEERQIRQLYKDIQYFASQRSINIAENNLNTFLSDLDIPNRLFLIAIVREINKDLKVLKDNDNIFTRTLLFSNIKNLSLLIENYMKNKLEKVDSLPSNNGLNNYIVKIFCKKNKEPWWSQYQQSINSGLTKSNNIEDFENNLKKIKNESNEDIKRLLYLVCIRNFSGHHFDVSSSFLFSHFKNLYKNILGVLYWIFLRFS